MSYTACQKPQLWMRQYKRVTLCCGKLHYGVEAAAVDRVEEHLPGGAWVYSHLKGYIQKAPDRGVGRGGGDQSVFPNPSR